MRRGKVYKLWLYESKVARPSGRKRLTPKTFSMRIYFKDAKRPDPIGYLFEVFRRVAPGAEVVADSLDDFHFVDRANGRPSENDACFRVNSYLKGIIGIEACKAPLNVAKRYLEKMAQEISRDFPQAAIERIGVF